MSETESLSLAYVDGVSAAPQAPETPAPDVRAAGTAVPFSESSTSGCCSRCRGDLPADRDRCPQCGCWTPANRGALKTGAHSARAKAALLAEQAATLAQLANRRSAIEQDLGGANGLSQISRDLVTRYIETSTIAEFLAGVLVANGPLTPRGRARSALNAYLQVLDRQHRLALALGLERRAKHVDLARALSGLDDER